MQRKSTESQVVVSKIYINSPVWLVFLPIKRGFLLDSWPRAKALFYYKVYPNDSRKNRNCETVKKHWAGVDTAKKTFSRLRVPVTDMRENKYRAYFFIIEFGIGRSKKCVCNFCFEMAGVFVGYIIQPFWNGQNFSSC